MLKRATWYGHEKMNDLQIYFWYRRQFCDKTSNEILNFPVEPGTIGEVVQANLLHISLEELHKLKEMRSEVHIIEYSNIHQITTALSKLCLR